MQLDNVNINEPIILVEARTKIEKGSSKNFSAKVIKVNKESQYKEGDIIFTDANYFVPFEIDTTLFNNTYAVNEKMVKGTINA